MYFGGVTKRDLGASECTLEDNNPQSFKTMHVVKYINTKLMLRAEYIKEKTSRSIMNLDRIDCKLIGHALWSQDEVKSFS